MQQPRRRRQEALASGAAAGIIGQDDESSTAIFIDLDILGATLSTLKAAPFPPGTLHTFAVKANPVGGVLEFMRDSGIGAEVASLGELRQALACGFPPDRVVFDSPIKTVSELRFALAAGVRLNLDNLQEVQRVADLVAQQPDLLGPPAGDGAAAWNHGSVRLIGLRINPQVGEGSIAALSTAGRVSKFGTPLLECREGVVAAFRRHPWLNALHLHVGSQGVPLELTVEGVARVLELAEDIEAACGDCPTTPAPSRRVLAFDIGGGLPVQYGTDDLSWLLGPQAAPAADASPPAGAASVSAVGATTLFDRYTSLLRQRVPGLFPPDKAPATNSNRHVDSANYEATSNPPRPHLPPLQSQHPQLPPPQLVTEFGRCLVAKAAFAAGRVEYTKACGGRQVVVSGLGGDLLLRAVYLPDTWPVRVELYGDDGRAKPGPQDAVNVIAEPVDVAPASKAGLGDGAGWGEGEGEGEGESERSGGGCGADEVGASVMPTDVVGPLCFQGDRLAEAVPLPPAAAGDWVVVPDVGAYTLSMYSRYNSRCSPPVWGFRSAKAVVRREKEVEEAGGTESAARAGEAAGKAVGGAVVPESWAGRVRRAGGHEFVLLRRGETVEEVVEFWNLR